jgi:hypothetical protein
MDVKIEGENAVRHLDLMTHNHACSPGGTPPMAYTDRMAMADIPECAGEKAAVTAACNPWEDKAKCPDASSLDNAKADKDAHAAAKRASGAKKNTPAHDAAIANWNNEMDSYAATISADPCHQKLRCVLSPYEPSKCCPNQTPHHLVEASAFQDAGREAGWSMKKGQPVKSTSIFGTNKYDQNAAPCICVEGENQHQATHGLMHASQNQAARDCAPGPPALAGSSFVTDKTTTLGAAQNSGAQAVQDNFPESNCDANCLKAQLKEYHEKKCGMPPGQPIRAVEA